MPPIVPTHTIGSLTGNQKALMDKLIDSLVETVRNNRTQRGSPLSYIAESEIRSTVISLIDKGYLKAVLHGDHMIEWQVWKPDVDTYVPLYGRSPEDPMRN
jgi:hypothetical protein